MSRRFRLALAGTTVYFPIFVAGGLFSIGDTHAVQGLGEVSGTVMETPMRIVYEINVIKGGRRRGPATRLRAAARHDPCEPSVS